MNELFLQIITFVHILVILFIIIVPFTSCNYLLLLYIIVVPFIVFHWVINDNTCALTLLEQHVRSELYGEPTNRNDCFTARLIEPIYDFANDYQSFSTAIYIGVFLLWALAVYKLYAKYRDGELRTFADLFTMC